MILSWVLDVLRGEDHVSNTAIQCQIFEALGGTVPRFGHFPLISGARGEALSKRLGSLSIEDLREKDFHPMTVVCALSRLGTP